MDIFGIGTAIKGMLRIYSHSARQTGRTQILIESLKNGDRIIFTNNAEANRVLRMCKDRKLDITVEVINPKYPQQIMEMGPPSIGRTIFDHTWVEQFYYNRIDQCIQEIDFFQRESSGYGEAHIKTKLQAEAYIRWGYDE